MANFLKHCQNKSTCMVCPIVALSLFMDRVSVLTASAVVQRTQDHVLLVVNLLFHDVCNLSFLFQGVPIIIWLINCQQFTIVTAEV